MVFPSQPAADIVLSPPPIQPRTLSLHPAAIAHLRAKIAEGCLAGVKLDPNPPPTERCPVHLPSVDKTSSSTIASKVRLLNVYPMYLLYTCYCSKEVWVQKHSSCQCLWNHAHKHHLSHPLNKRSHSVTKWSYRMEVWWMVFRCVYYHSVHVCTSAYLTATVYWHFNVISYRSFHCSRKYFTQSGLSKWIVRTVVHDVTIIPLCLLQYKDCSQLCGGALSELCYTHGHSGWRHVSFNFSKNVQ